MPDTYVGGFFGAYDGKAEVSIAFVIKHNVSKAINTAYQYLDNKCKSTLNNTVLFGTPYMGKMTKNKYVFSIVFGKTDNLEEGDEDALMRKLTALASVSNVSMEIEVVEESGVRRVDSQFWEKIRLTLREIAAYSGSADDWEAFKGYIKRDYGLNMTVGMQMTENEAQLFYEATLEYAKFNEIPIKNDVSMLKDIEAYVAKCRKNNVCLVCGKPCYDNTVYPVCQDHYDEYLELGKAGFEHKHYL